MMDACHVIPSHFECKYKRAAKNKPVKSQKFEIPGRTPLLISNKSKDTGKIPKDWKEADTVPAFLKTINRVI